MTFARDWHSGNMLFVGGLNPDGEGSDAISSEDVKEMLEHYGQVKTVFPAGNPPKYAVVHFEDEYSAERAARALARNADAATGGKRPRVRVVTVTIVVRDKPSLA